MNRATAINSVGAAMQAAVGVTNDPEGDYDIAISAAAPTAVDVLWPEIERLRAVVEAAREARDRGSIYTPLFRALAALDAAGGA